MRKILILRHIEIEGPGTLAEFLKKKGVEYSILDVFKDNGAALCDVDLNGVNGVLILGGPMNVYEDEKYPFLRAEKYFIRELVARKIPLLGICLGAQLIANALGARVRRAHEKEIGWYKISLNDNAVADALMKGLGKEIEVFQWHEDTFDLPAHAQLLANGNGLNQAFRFRDHAWGFQFHLEVDEEMMESWFRAYGKEGDLAEETLRKYRRMRDDFQRQAWSLYGAFLDRVIA